METGQSWTTRPFHAGEALGSDLVVKTSENREGKHVILAIVGDTVVSAFEVVDMYDALGPAEREVAANDGLVIHLNSSAADEAGETALAEAWLDSLDPAETPAEDPRDLRRIGLAQRALEDAEQDLRDSVAAAREAGRSWAEIGRSLGVTRQAAQMRFGKSAAPAHA